MPWGDEAFSAARDANKLIFLSIGYASCHWCHVMQRESFKDEATAKLINENFIPVKVDRESRPDVDELYMAYVVGSDRPRRLADDRVHDPRSLAGLRRHVLPAGARVRHAVVLGAADPARRARGGRTARP